MSCSVGHKCGLDLALLWLWCRPVATAPIQPLAWELPYAMGTPLPPPPAPTKKESDCSGSSCCGGTNLIAGPAPWGKRFSIAAQIRSLAQELPYTMGGAIKKKKKDTNTFTVTDPLQPSSPTLFL